MSALVKPEASRAKRTRATGPKTARGKSLAKLNAVTHGLRSLSPVLPDECPDDWTAHRAGTVAALAPVGTLETELADRVALLLWRLRRVVRYETAVTVADIEVAVAHVRGENDDENPLSFVLPGRHHTHRTYADVREELDYVSGCARGFADSREQLLRLSTLPAEHKLDGSTAYALLREVGAYAPDGHEQYIDIEDRAFLAQIGVPADWLDDADWWDGWTVGMIRAGIKIIADGCKLTEAALTEWAVNEADRTAAAERRKVMRLEAELARVTAANAGPERVVRGRALLPPADVVDKLSRYEAHLNRQLTQTLHTLERLRAIRDGNPPAPPAALDVTIHAGH